MDNMMIDSHKLMLHPHRVAYWLNNSTQISPIYMEVSPSGACNHRCKFCALDYMGYKPNILNVADYVKFITHQDGLKSVMFAGEGEPLMHTHFIDLVAATYARGIDCALTTNGVLLSPDKANGLVKMMRWIKISVDAGTAETYSKIHGCDQDNWWKLWRNIEHLVKVKGKCKVGLQFLLIQDNWYSLDAFMRLAIESGVDYVVIKRYSQHLKSINNQEVEPVMTYNPSVYAFQSTDACKIIIREDHAKRNYTHCLALPFWRYLQANGDLWACSAHIGDDRFRVGNIDSRMNIEHSLVWRLRQIDEMIKTFDIANCRLNCRMNNCNEYLHRLKNPMEHDNFI